MKANQIISPLLAIAVCLALPGCDGKNDEPVEEGFVEFGILAEAPQASVLDAGVSPCAVYDQQECVAGSIRKCSIYDGQAGS